MKALQRNAGSGWVNSYGLLEVPGAFLKRSEYAPNGVDLLNIPNPVQGGPLYWSADSEPPAVGARVELELRGRHKAEVVGYFAEYGWLGIIVRLDTVPQWLKQNRKDTPSPICNANEICAFGVDLISH